MTSSNNSDIMALTNEIRRMCAVGWFSADTADRLLTLCVLAEVELARLTVLMQALNERVRELHNASR